MEPVFEVLAADSPQPPLAEEVEGEEADQALIKELNECLAQQRDGRSDAHATEISAHLATLRLTPSGRKGSHFVWFLFCLLFGLPCFLWSCS